MFARIGPYAIREADKQQDIPAINALMEKYHQPEETMLKCLLSRRALKANEMAEITSDHRRIVEAMVVNFPCLVAVHEPSNEIVGVNLMIVSEDRAPRKKKSSKTKSLTPKTSLLVDYFHYRNVMIKDAELRERYGENRRIEFYAVVVSAKHRRLGLAKQLVAWGMEVAWEEGVDFVFGLFTSPISQSMGDKVGMVDIEVYDLLKYRDKHGSQIFENSIPDNLVVMQVALK